MSSVNQNAKRIKLVTLLVVAAIIGLKASSAEAAPLGRQLAELESHINWSAVDNAWKTMRPRWVATTAACDDPECVAQQLLQLEAHVKWKAVEGAWTKRRTSWVSDCKTASTEVEVAKLLLEFEENVRWQAVDERWKSRRDGWIADVKGN
jgi:hypothetical protein